MSEIVQGSPEWFAARLGRCTASRIADVMAKGRGNAPSATRANYLAQLVAERLTGAPYEGFTSAAMEWGTATEPQARANYVLSEFASITEVGFVPHPTIEMAGASPDGLVGDNGLVEFKCPNTATHIATLRGGGIPDKYMKQMMFQMACAGREWCDFVSFDSRLPAEMQLYVERVYRDEEAVTEIEAAVRKFLAEVDETVTDLRARYRAEAA